MNRDVLKLIFFLVLALALMGGAQAQPVNSCREGISKVSSIRFKKTLNSLVAFAICSSLSCATPPSSTQKADLISLTKSNKPDWKRRQEAGIVSAEDQQIFKKAIEALDLKHSVKFTFIPQTHEDPFFEGESDSWDEIKEFALFPEDTLRSQLKIYHYLNQQPGPLFIGDEYFPSRFQSTAQARQNFRKVFPNGVPESISDLSDFQKVLIYNTGASALLSLSREDIFVFDLSDEDALKKLLQSINANKANPASLIDFSLIYEKREIPSLTKAARIFRDQNQPQVYPFYIIYGRLHQLQDYKADKVEIERLEIK